MPNYDDVYSGKYAASSDKEFQPPGRRQTVLIHDAERQLVGPEQRPRVVITVVSPTGQLVGKPIALGKTNYERLKAAFGSETNNWLGQTVETYVELTQYSGPWMTKSRSEPRGEAIAATERGSPRERWPRPTEERRS